MKTVKALPYNRIIALIFVVYAAIQVYCINQLSVNYDEGSFAAYGSTILKFQRQKDVIRFESKLPITALNMIPRAIEQIFNPGLKKTWEKSITDILYGRYVSLFVSILLGLLIFQWSKELYDARTALFSLLFYLLCPNFLAHGIFLSSDIFACFFLTLSLYYLWRFCRANKPADFALMSASTGFALISKFSMLHLLIIIPVLLLVSWFAKKEMASQKKISIKKTLIYVGLFLFINWLIIGAAHFFYQVFLPFSDYSFMSSPFKSLQHLLPRIPVPLPSSYINSMDAVMYFDQLGGGVDGSLNGAPYILGQHSVKGFWYYYFVVIFFKIPIPVLLIWVASLFLFFRNFTRPVFFRNEIFLLFPVIYFLIYMNFFYSTQVGIRHIMIIFSLLYIFSGRFISKLFEWKKQFVLYLLLAYEIISVFSYFPHFLPYTNEFIVEKKLVYKKIADTNLCYGEGDKYLKEYLANNKDAIFQPDKPMAGKIVMEANKMLNLSIASLHKYDWISSFEPVAHIHSQYLVFEITQQEADSLQKLYR